MSETTQALVAASKEAAFTDALDHFEGNAGDHWEQLVGEQRDRYQCVARNTIAAFLEARAILGGLPDTVVAWLNNETLRVRRDPA